MCAACVIIGLMCGVAIGARGLCGIPRPYDRADYMLPIRDSKNNIIGATRWRSEGWARAGLEMLPPTHTRARHSLVGHRRAFSEPPCRRLSHARKSCARPAAGGSRRASRRTSCHHARGTSRMTAPRPAAGAATDRDDEEPAGQGLRCYGKSRNRP